MAAALVGMQLQRRWQGEWLLAAVVETEAYYRRERGSHASLGRTPSREALWAPAGTLYLYYSRGKDSLNISCRGGGNAVLVKAAVATCGGRASEVMHALNPAPQGGRRPLSRLCAGQTLAARALAIRVADWNGRRQAPRELVFADTGYRPQQLVQTTRLGIAAERDAHLPYRFIDAGRLRSCTQDPTRRRGWREGREYRLVAPPQQPAQHPAGDP